MDRFYGGLQKSSRVQSTGYWWGCKQILGGNGNKILAVTRKKMLKLPDLGGNGWFAPELGTIWGSVVPRYFQWSREGLTAKG